LGRLRGLSGNDVRRILSDHGFAAVRQRGSHIVMQLQKDDSTVTVPVPNHAELRIGTLLSIICQSKLPRTLFEIV
jgi:predicted RNA binding protein YcfA (HicA-like mRNA interferase family)